MQPTQLLPQRSKISSAFSTSRTDGRDLLRRQVRQQAFYYQLHTGHCTEERPAEPCNKTHRLRVTAIARYTRVPRATAARFIATPQCFVAATCAPRSTSFATSSPVGSLVPITLTVSPFFRWLLSTFAFPCSNLVVPEKVTFMFPVLVFNSKLSAATEVTTPSVFLPL